MQVRLAFSLWEHDKVAVMCVVGVSEYVVDAARTSMIYLFTGLLEVLFVVDI